MTRKPNLELISFKLCPYVQRAVVAEYLDKNNPPSLHRNAKRRQPLGCRRSRSALSRETLSEDNGCGRRSW